MIYKTIINNKNSNKKQFALLIDPDKHNSDIQTYQERKSGLLSIIEAANDAKVDFVLIGGSLILHTIDNVIALIKKNCSVPVILFPGSLFQISEKADGILLLSLISGRNPDFLIGNQVIAAPLLKKSGLEIIPTGYMLIESGKTTSVEYISNTKPIPHEKNDIAIATAIAGEMLGNKLIYLEAGSNAPQPISSKMIAEIKKNINVPLIVGGGIKTKDQITEICKAGADIIVVGTAIENDLTLLKDFSAIVHRC